MTTTIASILQYMDATVVDSMETGKNMNMQIGGKLAFNPNDLRRMVLSFVPTTISLTPKFVMTYS